MIMTNQELQVYTEEWSRTLFKRPFKHQIFFNRRLKTTGGRYHLTDHHIDINPLMYECFDLANLKAVVVHELCHYHLHLMGRDYHHRSSDFRHLLALTGGQRYAPAIPNREAKYRYQCQTCGVIVNRQRRFNLRLYVCRQCGGRFKLIPK